MVANKFLSLAALTSFLASAAHATVMKPIPPADVHNTVTLVKGVVRRDDHMNLDLRSTETFLYGHEGKSPPENTFSSFHVRSGKADPKRA